MPGGTRAQLGNELFAQAIYQVAVTYPTLGANASGTNTLPVAGVLPGDLLSWNLQAPPAHLFLENAYVSAAGVLTLSWTTDSTGISTGSVPIIFEVTRPENASLGLAALPTIVQ
jgi:hypothetical protein